MRAAAAALLVLAPAGAAAGVEGLPVARGFSLPLAEYHDVSLGYGRTYPKLAGDKPHRADDITGPGGAYGKTVVAVANGKVVFAWDDGGGWGSWGRVLIVKHRLPDGSVVYSQYAHLSTWSVGRTSPGAFGVEEQDLGEVRLGDPIGEVGNANGGYGTHLHFELRRNYLPADPRGPGYSHGDAYGWLKPTDFIRDHASLGIDFDPDRVAAVMDRKYEALGGAASFGALESPEPSHGIHWYLGSEGVDPDDCLIRDYDGGAFGDSAIVYDVLADAQDAFVVRSGFWDFWGPRLGGPRGSLGMPITDEYCQRREGGACAESRQDFQDGYLYFRRGASPAITENLYPHGDGPGSFSDGWRHRASYAIAAAYERNGARTAVGEPVPIGHSPAWVHRWGYTRRDGGEVFYYVQDFDWGEYGWSAVFLDPAVGDRAYHLRTGFWEYYRAHDGLRRLGVPLSDEAPDPGRGMTRQDFSKNGQCLFWNEDRGSVVLSKGSGCGPKGIGGGFDPRAIDNDGDGFSESAGDCADLDPFVNPDAVEVCDGDDDDCSGAADEGLDRGCESACGEGREVCRDGAWTGCDAPLDCRCDEPGAVDRQGCGHCGHKERVCGDNDQWEPFGACEDQGCPAGATDERPCGPCGRGRQTRLCSAACDWGDWGGCVHQEECAAGDRDGCGRCGTRVCGDDCRWGGCEGEGPCQAGDRDERRCVEGCPAGQWQRRTCSAECRWGAWNECAVCDADRVCFEEACVAPPARCLLDRYRDHLYALCPDPTPWAAARSVCERWGGGHLAVLDDHDEERHLHERLGRSYWIGFKQTPGADNEPGRQANEPDREWRWLARDSGYGPNWCPDEPNDAGDPDEDCAVACYCAPDDRCRWNDASCRDSNRFPYICERD